MGVPVAPRAMNMEFEMPAPSAGFGERVIANALTDSLAPGFVAYPRECVIPAPGCSSGLTNQLFQVSD